MERKMTAKQRRFVQEYLVDSNATQSAIRAGFSKRTAGIIGDQLLKKTLVAAEIQKLQEQISKKLGVDAEKVMSELINIAFADLGEVVSWGPDGVVLKNSARLTLEQRHLIAEVSQSDTPSGTNVKVKLHDKLKALELIGKKLGMFVEKREFEGALVLLAPQQIVKDDE